MKGAIERALELVSQTTNSWMPQQFENPANINVHVRTTALEILEDFADTPIDVMITGVGTGGHITGCAEVLKKAWPNLKVFAVEPTLSPVISGGQPGPHAIQGIGAGFIPANLHTALLDGVIQVDPEAAKETARRAARSPGASGAGLSRGRSACVPGAPPPWRGRGGGFSLGSTALGLGAGAAGGGFCAKAAVPEPSPSSTANKIGCFISRLCRATGMLVNDAIKDALRAGRNNAGHCR